MALAWVRLEVSKESLSSRLLPKLGAVGCDSYTPPKRTTAASSVLLTPPPQRGTVIAPGALIPRTPSPSQGLLFTSAKPLSYL